MPRLAWSVIAAMVAVFATTLVEARAQKPEQKADKSDKGGDDPQPKRAALSCGHTQFAINYG